MKVLLSADVIKKPCIEIYDHMGYIFLIDRDNWRLMTLSNYRNLDPNSVIFEFYQDKSFSNKSFLKYKEQRQGQILLLNTSGSDKVKNFCSNIVIVDRDGVKV